MKNQEDGDSPYKEHNRKQKDRSILKYQKKLQYL